MKRLKTMLQSIDHKGYPAYKSLKGSYQFGVYQLNIDHVQGDPFASPSRISIKIPGKNAKFPKDYYILKHRRITLEDHLIRLFHRELGDVSFKAKGSGKSGLISISHPGQEVLERSACHIDSGNGDVLLRISVGFPANGRSINAGELEKILYRFLPKAVEAACLYENIQKDKLQKAIELADDREYIREKMQEEDLVAFVANGSILPRESGVSDRPMKGAVPFASPTSMEVTWNLPHRGAVTGMGIPAGVTLIVGGGYHGKSTLLQTLEKAVYPHIDGDGREYVVTDFSAVKIRSEDGRSICDKNISMFIRNLPNGSNTENFSTPDASGSTSQAANVVEAVECGSKVLLMDEDTSATNFMIRDELMERVVAAGDEPIVPFIKRVRGMYRQQGISTILVAGSCGSFFHVADRIIQMESYRPKEITETAKEEAKAFPLNFNPEEELAFPETEREIVFPAKRPSGDGRERGTKIKVMGTDGFSINKQNVDLRYLEQITDGEQMMAIGKLLDGILKTFAGKKITLSKVLDTVMDELDSKGFAGMPGGQGFADMAMPRRYEVGGCVNRYRKKL
ncbi:MAG: ABC-ATPase domain-containing protein [Lachnospiraceae bacterium]|nr:ABC-ATPase domain-containing protein [Lachnospiraceae bacterium]